MYTLLLDNHQTIWQRLLGLYFPRGATIIDFTAGQAKLHVGLDPKYRLTLCDKQPGHVQRDLTKNDYADLGMHDAGLFDPPYLISRVSFDYPPDLARKSKGQWSRSSLSRHVENQSLQEFHERVEALNVKALQCVRQLLFIKVLDPRHKGELIPHSFDIWKTLTHWTLIDHAIYIRQGATTWTVKNHLQNLHGHWMAFRRNDQVPEGERTGLSPKRRAGGRGAGRPSGRPPPPRPPRRSQFPEWAPQPERCRRAPGAPRDVPADSPKRSIGEAESCT
jgi:hypothetical protein